MLIHALYEMDDDGDFEIASIHATAQSANDRIMKEAQTYELNALEIERFFYIDDSMTLEECLTINPLLKLQIV